MTKALAGHLKAIGKHIAAKLSHLAKPTKMSGPGDKKDEDEAVDGADWASIADAVAAETTAVAADGAKTALTTLGVSDDKSITSQTFTKAVDAAKARAAELVGKSWDDDGNLVDNPDAEMSITETMRDEIRDAVAEAIENGDSAADLADTIEGLGSFSEDRAMMIARTECLLPDTPVDAAVVRAAFRRAYDGDVIEIVTAAGRKLTATPNHPMLTRRGWVAAGELTEFDYLVCDNRKKDLGAGRDDDEHGGPPSIGEIFGALADAMTPERYTSSRLDFHGDGVQGDVDVVRPDRELMLGEVAQIRKPSAHLFFPEANHTRATFCPSCSRLLTIDQQPCFCRRPELHAGARESESDGSLTDTVTESQGYERLARNVSVYNLLNGETFAKGRSHVAAGIVGQGGRTSVPQHHFSLQSEMGALVADAHRLGDYPNACAGLVDGNRTSNVDGPAHLHERSGAFIPVHARLDQDGAESFAGDAKLPGDNMAGSAGFVEFDRVRFVKRASYSGHVYNLETPYGYFLVAGGVYTGNTIRAHAQGQLRALKESGVVEKKGWSVSGNAEVCDECQANEDQGAIDLDDDFESGDDAPPAHPLCVCVLIAAFDEAEESADEEDEEQEQPDEGDEQAAE